MPFRDDDRQRLDPREFPEPDASDDGSHPCPVCLAVIADDSEQCPACGHFVTDEQRRGRRPWWVVLGLLVSLALAIYWIWPVP